MTCIRPREHGNPVRLEPGVRDPQVGGERGDDGGLLDPGVGIRDRAGGKKKAWKDHQEDEARRPARVYRDLTSRKEYAYDNVRAEHLRAARHQDSHHQRQLRPLQQHQLEDHRLRVRAGR